MRIVLSGSGTLYPLHAGALWALSDLGISIDEIAAVSGGSIIAALVGSGYKPGPDLNEVLENYRPEYGLWDLSWNPFKSWGLIKGDRIYKKLQEILVSNLTETNIPLHIIAVNIDSAETYVGDRFTVFSRDSHPDIALADMVRASISIPGAFVPHKIRGQRYIDGGVANNYPLDLFGTGEDVIGVKVRSGGPSLPPTSFKDYPGTILNLMMESIDAHHIQEAVFAKTVLLDVPQGSIDLKMTKDELRKLIDVGYIKMHERLGLKA